MAYNTQPIKKDVDGRPIPQYFNAQQDEYQVLQGEHGAARSILYGPDGQPVGTQERPLEVKARDLEDLIGALAADPDALSILGRLKALADRLGDAVATPAAYTVLARLAAVEKKLADLETLIQGGIQLKGSVPVIWGANISERPAASEVPVGTQFIIANENLDAWVSNGTDWVVI